MQVLPVCGSDTISRRGLPEGFPVSAPAPLQARTRMSDGSSTGRRKCASSVNAGLTGSSTRASARASVQVP